MSEPSWLPGRPIVQAPMAGGPSTPELVAAVCGSGGLGFLAAGYKSAADMRAEIDRTRALTGEPFGVNVFMPTADTPEPGELDRYRRDLAGEARRLGVALGTPHGGDDGFDAKIEDLLAAPPPVVSFTFGCPDDSLIRAFQRRGTAVLVTVTTVEEARSAAAADGLCVQGAEAGGHRGSFTNDELEGVGLHRLLSDLRPRTRQPLIAAGGIASPVDLGDVLALGAVAGMAGTAFLRCPESGTSAVHRAALTDPRLTRTAMTRAFTGRPARGLVNRFLTEHSAQAPAAYPHVHHLTAPLRKEAAARGDVDTVHLWAGQSWRHIRQAPAADIVADLTRL
ncbi:NAD(P)H-dependent flavin oxidoreductase [Actinocorallia populi]|uniref:NAD(P)H-dependent flavin oxidoreductase n=1 Tax=Actinocorallia populi TaxID=2079200 RepID=UPI001E45F1A8|nr:nitronate monooxygenase [Actinocorallia populi]